MNSLPQLVEWAKGIKQQFPQQKDEIWSFISLCIDEIEEGGSESHEVQLAYNDICDLVGLDQ